MTGAVRVRGRRPAAAPARALPAVGLLVLALVAGCSTTSPSDGSDGSAGSGPSGSDSPSTSTAPATPDPGPTAPEGQVGPGDPQAYADALFVGTNRVRAEEGLPELTEAACAVEAATGRAQDLVGAEGLEHAPMDPVLEACSPATVAAENLSRATAPAGDIVEAWMDSPGHRANLLSDEVSELGVACVPDGEPLVCAQIFLGP